MKRYKYDVFLSHSTADKSTVRQIAQQLHDAGLTVWFDEWITTPGEDIFLSVESGLEHSRSLALFISRDALESDWVGLEKSTTLFRNPKNKTRRFIPIVIDECKIPDTLGRYKYLDFRQDQEQGIAELINICRGSRKQLTALQDSSSTLTPTVIRAQKTKDFLSRVKKPSTITEAMQILSSKDPLLTLSVIDSLKGKPTYRDELLEVPANSVTDAAIRSTLASYPEASAETILDRIRNCGITGDPWQRARRASSLASPPLRSFVEHELVALLGSQVEVQRHAITALGEVGAIIFYKSDLVESLVRDYRVQKCLSWAVAAALRSFEVATDPRELRMGAELLISLATIHDGQSVNPLYQVSRAPQCDFRHVDAITERLLTSSNSAAVSLGLKLLGDIGAVRSASPILNTIIASDDEGFQQYAARTIWRLRNHDVIAEMRRRTKQTVALHGVEISLDSIMDGAEFDILLPGALKTPLGFMALRAIGLRLHSQHESVLRAALSSTDPVDRGVAALSLARMGGSTGLKQAYREASDPHERIFTALALLVAGLTEFSQLELQLRRDLVEESCSYMSELQWDILMVLSECGSEDALALARAWAPFYAGYARNALSAKAAESL